jgi:hypothetical protein
VTIATLRKTLLVPAKPVENLVPKGGWEAVARILGTALPADFEQFIETYGTGAVASNLWIHNPFSRKLPWFAAVTSGLAGLTVSLHSLEVAKLRKRTGKLSDEPQGKPKHRPFPAAGGLLPLGSSGGGQDLFWVTQGAPDAWPIYMADWRGGADDLFKGTLSELVVMLLTKHRFKSMPEELGPHRKFVVAR